MRFRISPAISFHGPSVDVDEQVLDAFAIALPCEFGVEQFWRQERAGDWGFTTALGLGKLDGQLGRVDSRFRPSAGPERPRKALPR